VKHPFTKNYKEKNMENDKKELLQELLQELLEEIKEDEPHATVVIESIEVVLEQAF
jgi:hypothetical protein